MLTVCKSIKSFLFYPQGQEVLKQKYLIDINSESPIDQILSSENFKIDPKIGPILSNKRSIISWSFKTWSSEFKMHLWTKTFQIYQIWRAQIAKL